MAGSRIISFGGKKDCEGTRVFVHWTGVCSGRYCHCGHPSPAASGTDCKPAGGGADVLPGLAAAYFLLLAAAGIFDSAKESLITVFGQKVTHGLRSVMCRKLSILPASYLIDTEPGVAASRFVNDVDTVESLFTSGIISMVVDICRVVSILAVIFIKSRGLGMLMVLASPILYLITHAFQKRMLKSQLANRAAVGRANSHVPETIRNIRMIHTFHKEKYMEICYGRYILAGYQALEKSNFYDSIYSPIIITIRAALIAVMMVLTAMGGNMQELFGMSGWNSSGSDCICQQGI